MMLASISRRLPHMLFAATLALISMFAPFHALDAQAPHARWTQTHESTQLDASDLLQPVRRLGKAVAVDAPVVIARQVNAAAFEQLRIGGDMTLRRFPLPDGTEVDLELRSFSLFNEHSIVLSRNAQGEIRRDAPDVRLYRGRVGMDQTSFAYLAVAPGDMTGSVTYRGTEYSFTTQLDELPTEGDRILNIYEATDEMKAFECNVKDEDFIQDIMRGMDAEVAMLQPGMDTLSAKLAIEIDYEAFLHYGGVTEAENYVTSLMGYVNAIYERDVAVTFEVSYLRTWEEEDPYSGASDRAALNTFTEYWRENMDHVDRTLASLISRKPISAGGVTQGLAWVNQLCSHTHGYAYVKLSSRNSNVEGHAGVWAHELGHNFGSPHTHACVWNPPIDSCYTAEPVRNQAPCFGPADIHLILGGGELMSYCHMRYGNSNSHKVFRERTGALVRGNSERALCMNVTSFIRSLVLLTPVGGESLCAGNMIDITWEATGNNDFSILLSSDNGATYDQVLVDNLPRNTRSWQWTIPAEFPVGTEYRIRIMDNKLSELQDEMPGSFEVREGTVITEQVHWRNVCVGEGAWFYVRAEGAGELTYQWKRNGVLLEGEERDELQLEDLGMDDNLAAFTCEITGDCGTIESEPALLKVFNSAVIKQQAAHDTACIGGSAQFEIIAEGSNLSYKWYFRSPSGVNRSFDVDAPILTLTDITKDDLGAYWCDVNSSCGKATSQTRFLLVPETSVEVLQPSVWNQVIPAGSKFTIGWRQFCLSTLKIEYSTDNGNTWNLISGAFDAAAGEYSWQVPEVEADQCFIRLSSANDLSINGQSKQFMIKDVPVYSRNLEIIGFSWVGVGETAESSLVIDNLGRAELQVSKTTLLGLSGGSIPSMSIKNGAPFTVPARDNYTLLLEYAPATASRVEGHLIITHDAAGSPDTIDVIGESFITTSATTPSQPLQLSLSRNYPNPVSLATGGKTQIHFDLPHRAMVEIALYNSLGVRLRTLYSGERVAGRHTLSVQLSALAPGVYFYRLVSGDEAVTRMLQILR
ncbi:MAG: T9SS type A sorting domain-containing protein [Bacteroidetes bacterium]|nr:T9SS type A sorting domain-containing protein [Bacteroidota bacterium]